MAIKTYLEENKKLYEVYVNGFDARGKRIQKRKRGIESLRKAESTEFEFKHELAKLRESNSSTYTWSEWHAECIRRMTLELMPSTVMGYDRQLQIWVHPHWADKEISSFTKSDVYDLIFNKCEAIVSQYTKRNILKMIKRIFQLAVEDGILDRNPCSGVSVRVAEVTQKVLTTQEVEIFLREAKDVNHRFFPVWAIALMTGMRSGEMFALRWTDIDLDSRTISITRQWTSKNGFCPTKTRKSRIVPISEDLLLFLKELRLKHKLEDEFILPRLGEWEHGEQARVTREFCATIGITPVKFHDLRATFITNLLARGESLARVMSIVGHSELKTTNCYLRKAGVDVQGGTDKLGYKLPKEEKARVFSIVGRNNR